jgi:hypothetical protein
MVNGFPAILPKFAWLRQRAPDFLVETHYGCYI